jgi:hypothetical protein
MPRSPIAATILSLTLALPVAAAAQSTGTPVFHAPYRAFERSELGGNVSDAGNISIEGFYGFAPGSARWDLALRGGIQDGGRCCRTAVLLGVDGRYRIIDHTEDFPLDGALITGVGARLVRGGSLLFIPVGVSLGRRLLIEDSSLSLVPYVEPVIGFAFGNGDSDLLVALGLGADLRLTRRFELRAAVGIGDIETFSIGFAITR